MQTATHTDSDAYRQLEKVGVCLIGSGLYRQPASSVAAVFSSGLRTTVFTQLIVDKLVVAGHPLLLVLDRTHWQLGQTDLHLLCLGLVFQGASIPLISLSLQRPGNSHTREQKQVVRQALPYLKGSTCCLLADREFIGKDGFQFLLRQRDVSFVIRIRCSSWVTLDDGQLRHLASITRYWKRGLTRTFYNVTLYRSRRLNLVVHLPLKGDPLLLITNRSDLDQVVATYGQRWSIEIAFGFLKSKGFHWEETRLTQPTGLTLLIGLLAVGLLWCLLIGLQQHQQKPIVKKKHGRRAISLFRFGSDRLQQLICQSRHRPKAVREAG